ARTNPQSAEAAAAKPSVPELVPVSPTEASNWTAMAALLEQLCATSTVDDADSWGSCRAYRLIRLVPAALVSESDDQLPAVQDDEASEPPPPPPLATPASSAELTSMAKSSTASLGQAFPAELLCSRRSNRLAAASANSASASASGGGDSTAEDSDDDDDELAAAAGSSDAASAAAAVCRSTSATAGRLRPLLLAQLRSPTVGRLLWLDATAPAAAAAAPTMTTTMTAILLSPFRLDELLSRLSESAELYTPADAAAVFCGLLAEHFPPPKRPRLGILADNPNVSVSGLHCLPAESLCLVALAHLELRLDRRRVKDAANWVSTDLSWPNLESLAHSIACLLLRLASPPARLLLRLAWARLRLSAACRRGLDDQAAFGYLAAGLDSPLVSPNSPDWPVVNLAALRRLRRAAKSGREFALASAAARSGNSAAVVAALRRLCTLASAAAMRLQLLKSVLNGPGIPVTPDPGRQICEMFVSSCYRSATSPSAIRTAPACSGCWPQPTNPAQFEHQPWHSRFAICWPARSIWAPGQPTWPRLCAQLAACADLIVRCLRHRVPLTDAEAWIYLHRHFVFLIEETEKQINDKSMDTVHVSAHCVIEAVAEAVEVDSDAAAEKPVLEAGTGQAAGAGTGQAKLELVKHRKLELVKHRKLELVKQRKLELVKHRKLELSTHRKLLSTSEAELSTHRKLELKASNWNCQRIGSWNCQRMEAGTVNAINAGSGQMQVAGEVDEARIRAELRQPDARDVGGGGGGGAKSAACLQCRLSAKAMAGYCTTPWLVWCRCLLRQQPPPDHPAYLAVDQAFHCLYGLGRRGRYSRAAGSGIIDAADRRLASLPADLERCFDLAAAGLPDRLRVDANAVNDFLFGGVDTLPEYNRPLTPDERLTADIHYLLADCCLKSNRFLPAIKHYLRDLALSPDRFDSWAGMALARCSRLQQKLNLQDGSNSSTVSRKYSLACLRSFDQALRINPLCPKLLTERGLFAYELHSHASQLGRRGKQLELAAEWRLPMLRLARESFLQAASAANHPELRDAGEECENWLYNYMLGKCCEKSADHPDICLGYYAAAANELRQSGARYPKRISTSYGSTPRLAVEALEMQYRQLAIVCKQLLMFLPRPKSAVSSPTTASVNLSWIEARLIELSKSAFQRRDALGGGGGGGGGEGSKRRHAGGGGSGRTRRVDCVEDHEGGGR
uniref:HECT domain-containing protein n=1 Tax=Macrostomum lignano TaxID=282301 RepID=A0A1I8F8B2_9PLAT